MQPDAGRELPTRMTDSVPGASSKEEVKGEHMEGVTPEHLSAPAEVLSLERMVGRFGHGSGTGAADRHHVRPAVVAFRPHL